MRQIVATCGRGLLLAGLSMFLAVAVFAQSKTVTGNVVSSENQQALSGVTITAKGTKTRVTSDKDGNFRVTVPSATTTLVISYAGYTEQEISVANKTAVQVIMMPDVKAIDDVVVIGYQTVKRKDLLASVSSIGAKDLKDVPINSAAEALNGRLAGVTASTSEGSPDADVRIRIRGGMSITQDNSPLYVIDGVQMENALNYISPQDIQSIDVLKDASATAIYGARGANGVIVITTKAGRVGKLKVNYNGFVGVKTLTKKLDVMDPYDYVFYQSERSRGSSQDSLKFLDDFGHTWDTLDVYKSIAPIDWQEKIFGQTGVTTTHNISASGGTKKLTYNFGYTFNDEKAIVINSKYNRHLLNAKADYKISKKLKVGGGVRYTLQNVYGAGISDQKGSQYNRLRNAIKYKPFLSKGQDDFSDADPLADPNAGNGLTLVNPLQLASAEYRRKTTENANVNAYLSYNITKNIVFRSTFGYEWNSLIDRQFYDSIAPYAVINGGKQPVVGLDTSIRTTITNSNTFTYSVQDWKNRHDFSVVLGEETYDLRNTVRNSLFKNYPLNTDHSTAFEETDLGVSFAGYPKLYKSRYTSVSFFGRINYAYRDKYLFSANLRADGASKFGPGNKWGYFPAGSFAWRITNEKFMERVKFINDLKLRVGYGQAGNNRIKDYLYLTTFSNAGSYYYGLDNTPVLGYYSASLVNADLRWESTVNRNIGLDVTFLDRRFDLSVDVYRNSSNHLLLDVPVASTYGYSTQLQNIGKTSNKGVEIQLNASIVRRPEFTWNANFNISFNKNRIEQLGSSGSPLYPGYSWGVSGQIADFVAQIGQPVGAYYGYVTDGFYTTADFNYDASTGIYTLKPGVVDDHLVIGTVQPGSLKLKDLGTDNIVDPTNDRTILGSPNPKYTGGLTQTFTYKRWDASLFVNFSVGAKTYNANKIELTNGYTANSNMLALMSGRYKTVTPDGQTALWVSGSTVYGIAPDQLDALNANATIWQPLRSTGAFSLHSWAIEDASFLRFNNLTVGYTIPAKALGKAGLDKLRFYVTLNNFALITSYTGFDPETSVRSNPLTPGLDYSAYPRSRSFIFGVNASF